jgi:hypothetical protein
MPTKKVELLLEPIRPEKGQEGTTTGAKALTYATNYAALKGCSSTVAYSAS